MHLLPCPSCQASISVSPSQAGDQVNCPECQSAVPVPKLGELRKLPQDDTLSVDTPSQSEGRGFLFLILGLIGCVSLVIAGFCGIRWALIDVPATTEIHLVEVKERYESLSAAELVREYEDMDKYGLELATPFKYKVKELNKSAWGGKAAGAGTVALIAFVLAFLFGNNRRQPA